MKLLPLLNSVALSVSSLFTGVIQKRPGAREKFEIIAEAKTFAERRLEKLTFLVVAGFLCASRIGAKKEIVASPSRATLKLTKASLPKITIYPIIRCIYSYPQLISELYNRTVRVKSVILDDGTLINTRKGIVSITYTAFNLQEPYSLFRSELKVVNNLYGRAFYSTAISSTLSFARRGSG
jgi:hypothetical protein